MSEPAPYSRLRPPLATRRGGSRVGRQATETARCPVVSVITVVYNAAQVLEQAILSVVEQRCELVEYIVVDGGSTDGTVELIERYGESIDWWTSEPDEGVYDAMNKALGVARGEWLIFIGADDALLAPLDAVIVRLREPGSIYYGDVEIEHSKKVSGGRFSKYRLMQENICHQAVFYPRCVYATKRYDTTIGPLADHRYNIEVWGMGVPFVHLDHVISRFNEAGLSSIKDARFESVKLDVIRQSFGRRWYLIKRLRTALVRLIKPRHGTA